MRKSRFTNEQIAILPACRTRRRLCPTNGGRRTSVSDTLGNERAVRVFTLVDDCSRESGADFGRC